VKNGLWALGFLLSCGAAFGEDVVFSATAVRKSEGAYFPVGAAHLYRVGEDGKGLVQLTSGDQSDTDPCHSADRGRIFFWRQDPMGLIGQVWQCAIKTDGSDLKVLRRESRLDLGSPADSEEKGRKKPGMEFKLTNLEGKPDPTDSTVDLAYVDDNTRVFGYYGGPEHWMGMATAAGHLIREISITHKVHGKKLFSNVFGDEQWKMNPEGSLAFWYGREKERILLQEVARTNDGGDPGIYCFNAKTGLVSFEIAHQFLQDMDSDRSHFLTTTWEWGKGQSRDGAVPLSQLMIWQAGTVKAVPIGLPLAHCGSAIFCPSAPKTAAALAIAKPLATVPSSSKAEIVFSAKRYGEKLGIVFPGGAAHLYRIGIDGRGSQQLTSGEHDDIEPTIAADGKDILFWRSIKPFEEYPAGPYRLYSISVNGSELKDLHAVLHAEPDSGTAQAMLLWGSRRLDVHTGYGEPGSILYDRSGRRIVSDVRVRFSPDGRFAIAVPREDDRAANSKSVFVVDLAKETKRALKPDAFAPAWMGDRTIVALKGPLVGEGPLGVFTMDTLGHEVRHVKLRLSSKNEESPDDDIQMKSSIAKAFLLWDRDELLWETHHYMSDGGYDYAFRINLKTGTAQFVGEDSIEAVSSGGRAFVSLKYDWVGGYKGEGAAKLCTMYLWDARLLKERALGFRTMDCEGACFVTGGG
jgi:hypothetical protein